jgi:hypothetical protein
VLADAELLEVAGERRAGELGAVEFLIAVKLGCGRWGGGGGPVTERSATPWFTGSSVVGTASGAGGAQLVAKLAGDLVALGDDAASFLGGDGSAVGVADDGGLAAPPAGTMRVSNAVAIWHRALLWCLPAWTMSRW